MLDSDKASQEPIVLDMGDRDPSGMNSYLKVDFTDLIAEPEGLKSHENLFDCASRTYTCSKNCCYFVLTFVFGGPLAFCFGCYFACLGFEYIWCVIPCVRAWLIRLECFGWIFAYCIKNFCDPCFYSIGKIFSRIHKKTETV